MTADRYWSTGITVHCRNGKWGAELDFYDSSRDDNPDTGQISTQGKLTTRYMVGGGQHVTGLRAAIDAVVAAAERLNIEYRGTTPDQPSVYYKGDGEWSDYPPPDGWQELLAAEASRIGWCNAYEEDVAR